MILVQLKPLLQRLGHHCAKTLEQAAALCISRSHQIVSSEHLLRTMVEQRGDDFALAARHFGLNLGALARSLDQQLDDAPGSVGGKPVFGVPLIEWLQDAWILASVDQQHARLRTGILLRALSIRQRRYLAEHHSELDKVSGNELLHHFDEITEGSIEARQGMAGQGMAGQGMAGQGMAGQSGSGRAGAVGATQKRGKASLAANSALARFAHDLTGAAREGRIDPVFARDREIRQMIDILARRRKNNPIVVGEAGVGKTAIVEGLALRIAVDDVPEFLREIDIFTLDIGLLQAGAGVKGEFESRLRSVIDEVRGRTRGTILFIDEAHTLVGAGGPSGSTDAANLLKPALARGELRTIAATTWAEYKKYFEEDAALARRFQPVKVDEPSIEGAGLMLRGLKQRYEDAHGVTVRDDAIDAAVRLSARYIAGRLLPDKAVDLLDTAAARVRIGQSSVPGPIEDVDRSIKALERRQHAIERDRRGGSVIDHDEVAAIAQQLDEQQAKRRALQRVWDEQRRAVEAVRAARKGAGDEDSIAHLSEALTQLQQVQGRQPLVRVEVDPEVVAEVVADWTGVPVGRMMADDAGQALALEALLGERIKGQRQALKAVGRALRGARAGLADPGKPRVFLLVGPSGVGKTELGLAVADALFGGERFVVTINMSEYQDREMGVSGLIGAKPGYVGYGKGGVLTEAVRQRPYSVVLLDEIEKSCQEVRNLFYQVFDKGHLTDGTGRGIDFKNTVIFMTTNMGAELIAGMCAEQDEPEMADVVAALRPMLNRTLSPAWLARTTVIPLLSLGSEALKAITLLKLDKLAQRMLDAHRVQLSFAPAVIDHIVKRCEDVETGARNIDFIIDSSLMPALSRSVLERLSDGALPQRMKIGLDRRHQLTVQFEDESKAPRADKTPPAKKTRAKKADATKTRAKTSRAKKTRVTKTRAKKAGSKKTRATKTRAKTSRAKKTRINH